MAAMSARWSRRKTFSNAIASTMTARASPRIVANASRGADSNVLRSLTRTACAAISSPIDLSAPATTRRMSWRSATVTWRHELMRASTWNRCGLTRAMFPVRSAY
eukprot:Amastigsp_a250_252.p5 type:complete len:105 gc:universal Amastigsp_a250_252:689-1003(+)